jgi:hypothetical protein
MCQIIVHLRHTQQVFFELRIIGILQFRKKIMCKMLSQPIFFHFYEENADAAAARRGESVTVVKIADATSLMAPPVADAEYRPLPKA